ncbi:hypothetical protein PLICRDRAFT_30158 [Plicaturopsis crispa FD-325 SS-3]|nr:hypothetical protein PLICRDRAFT_30158 [Plicaturopsis crispa FD-325 SS-3]
MHFPTTVLFMLVATLSATAQPSAPEWRTNSERLARGLPLLPPKFGRRIPGYAAPRDVPTPVYQAKRGGPSATPWTPAQDATQAEYTGRVKVSGASSTTIGFLNNWASAPAGLVFGVPDGELHVSTSGASPFYDLLIINTNFTAPFYFGAHGGATLAIGSPATSVLGPVNQTDPSTSGESESAIWAIDPKTKALTPQYINPDGSAPATFVAYNASANQLFLVGDLNAYNAAHADVPAENVTLSLEDF